MFVRLILTESFVKFKKRNERVRGVSRIQHCPRRPPFTCGFATAFGSKIISPGLWPARSPDLTPCDFYLWDYLKNKVYRTYPYNEEESYKKILRITILGVHQKEHLRVNSDLFKWYRKCLHVQGHHFQRPL
jgi:hypothetical protein